MEIKSTEVLTAKSDESVNFVFRGDFPGAIEARFVPRSYFGMPYFVIYVSTQTGCKQGCAFCHLTRTNQTTLADVPRALLLRQVQEVAGYVKATYPERSYKRVHVSCMARGEPLDSQQLTDDTILEWELFLRDLGYHPRTMISTILPKSFEGKSLIDLFPVSKPNLYYSLYSLNKAFRRKWLPAAMDPGNGLGLLRQYQEYSGKLIKLHWAFIAGENDNYKSLQDIASAIRSYQLRVSVNIVRYNTYGEEWGKEVSEERLEDLVDSLRILLPEQTRVDVITRADTEISKAACGMFV